MRKNVLISKNNYFDRSRHLRNHSEGYGVGIDHDLSKHNNMHGVGVDQDYLSTIIICIVLYL